MRDIEVFAKQALEASVKIGVPLDLGGVADAVTKPEYAVAVGLAELAADNSHIEQPISNKKKKAAKAKKPSGNILKKLFSKF